MTDPAPRRPVAEVDELLADTDPQPPPRAVVVGLLAAVDMDPARPPSEWRLRSGAALSAYELAVIASATDAELAAYARLAAQHDGDQAAAVDAFLWRAEELLALVAPHLDVIPRDTALRDVARFLPAELCEAYHRALSALVLCTGEPAPARPGCCSPSATCSPPPAGPVSVTIGTAP